MANPSRVLDATDTIVGAIRAIWGPTAPSGVQRSYAPDIGLSGDSAATLVQGRQVYCFPATFGNDGAIDRSNWDRVYTIQTVVVERYAVSGSDQQGPPPNSWVDARVLWTEQTFNYLANPKTVLTGGAVNLYRRPEDQATVDEVYDLDILMKHKAFWSLFTIVVREVLDLSGG